MNVEQAIVELSEIAFDTETKSGRYVRIEPVRVLLADHDRLTAQLALVDQLVKAMEHISDVAYHELYTYDPVDLSKILRAVDEGDEAIQKYREANETETTSSR